jgi:hypothetical protein
VFPGKTVLNIQKQAFFRPSGYAEPKRGEKSVACFSMRILKGVSIHWLKN